MNEPIRYVQDTPEFRRVWGLASRDLEAIATPEFALSVSEALRRNPEAVLRPLQAAALLEFAAMGGLFVTMGVGEGKTLITLLLPLIAESARPLLVLPAKLIEKTRREMRVLAQSWPVPKHIRLISYEYLGRTQAARELTVYRPDLVILDEGHKAKNPSAAVTKRLSRYVHDYRPKVAVLSGTMTKRSLRDYAHLLIWAYGHHPGGPPVTREYHELVNWADAIDEKPSSWYGARCHPGVILSQARPEDFDGIDNVRAARIAYRRRVTSTPGVIHSGANRIDASLYVTCEPTPAEAGGPALEDAFTRLRRDWVLPDGTEMIDGMEVWRHARELGMGFYYRWDPPGPPEWKGPRSAWAKTCRKILQTNRRSLDSELQVKNAIREGHYPEARETLAEWEAVKPTFAPHTVPVWLSDFAIDHAAHWLHHTRGGPGIVWVEHKAFGHRLSERAGVPYFGGRGICKRTGGNIEDYKGPCVASIAANAEGRNLQRYARNLIMPFPTTGLQAEQLLGRTHRYGQQADEVTAEVWAACSEHIGGLYQAIADARYIGDATGGEQKLSYCDLSIPSEDEIANYTGESWQ